MKLTKIFLCLVFTLSFCTACSSNREEKINYKDKYDSDKAYGYQVGDVVFSIADYFDFDDETEDTKTFTTYDYKDFFVTIGSVENTLTKENAQMFLDVFLKPEEMKNMSYSSKLKEYKPKKYCGNRYFAKISGEYRLSESDVINADFYCYFISNNAKTNYSYLILYQPEGLKYDYSKDVQSMISHSYAKDDESQVTNSTDNTSDTTTSNSSTTKTPNTDSSASTNSSASTPTVGQKNALNSALDYLDCYEFSRQGLIDQLLHDGYTQEEAEYGADHTNANWDEEAALKAMDYLSVMSFSRQGLIEQLMFDGFTQEQAEYGVTQNGY